MIYAAGVGVQFDQPIAGADEDHALVASPVGPIRYPASGQLARGDRGAIAFTEAIRPIHFAGLTVQRDDGSARATVVYSVPLISNGVPSNLYSGRGPRLSVLKRHATSSLLKLEALI